MNRDLAEFVARIAFKNSSELSRLVPILKKELDEKEFEIYANVIKKISQKIGSEILLKIFREYPDIEKSFEKAIKNYGTLP